MFYFPCPVDNEYTDDNNPISIYGQNHFLHLHFVLIYNEVKAFFSNILYQGVASYRFATVHFMRGVQGNITRRSIFHRYSYIFVFVVLYQDMMSYKHCFPAECRLRFGYVLSLCGLRPRFLSPLIKPKLVLV